MHADQTEDAYWIEQVNSPSEPQAPVNIPQISKGNRYQFRIGAAHDAAKIKTTALKPNAHTQSERDGSPRTGSSA